MTLSRYHTDRVPQAWGMNPTTQEAIAGSAV